MNHVDLRAELGREQHRIVERALGGLAKVRWDENPCHAAAAAKLRSYELFARNVAPRFQGQ